MNRFFKLTLLATAAIPLAYVGPAAADELSDMKAQMQVLQSRIGELETKQAQVSSVEQVAPAQAVTGGDFPKSFKLPGSETSIKIGGYVRVDAVKQFGGDFGGIQSDPSLVPVNGTTGANQDGAFGITAQRSRINLETRTPTQYGSLRTFIEGDFAGGVSDVTGKVTVGASSGSGSIPGGPTQSGSNSSTFRLRHAYAEFGPVLAGQTYTNFFDPATQPETLDLGGAAGGAGGNGNVRQAQIRYNLPIGPGTLHLSVENPQSVFQGSITKPIITGTPVLTTTNVVDRYPDLVARYDADFDWGHASLAGVVSDVSYDTGGVAASLPSTSTLVGHGDVLGGGGVASIMVKTFGKDNLMAQVGIGSAVGRYFWNGLTDAVANPASNTNSLEAIQTYSGYLAYQHWWTETIRSTAVGGWIHSDGPTYGTAYNYSDVKSGPNVPKDLATAHLNAIWSPVPATNIGLEYEVAYIGYSENTTAAPANHNFGLGEKIQATLQFGF